jgi:hypothetical protein
MKFTASLAFVLEQDEGVGVVNAVTDDWRMGQHNDDRYDPNTDIGVWK